MAIDAEPEKAPEQSAAASVIVPPDPSRPRRLSDELDMILREFEVETVTIREVITVLQDRAYDLLLLLLALPFLLPVPLLGLSTPFGTVIAVIAARVMLGQRPWLPARLLDSRIPPKFFPTLLRGARRILRAFEVLLKPRMLWLTASRLPQLHAFIIFVAAVLLLLPLPPGTNFPPALCIVVMAAGLLERDGLFVLCGYIAFALNAVFFTLFGIYGTKLFHIAWEWLRAW